MNPTELIHTKIVQGAESCSGCGGRERFESPVVMDRGEGNVAFPLTVGRTCSIHARDVGEFAVRVCLGCGRAEFYVKAPETLRSLVPQGASVGARR